MKLYGQAQDPPNKIALAMILIHLSVATSEKINTNTSIMCKETQENSSTNVTNESEDVYNKY